MTQRYTLSKPLCAREALRHDMSIVEVPSSKFRLLCSPLGWDRTVEDTKFVLVKSGVYCFPAIANNCEPVYSPVEMCYDIWQFSDAGCRFLFTITSRWYRPLTSSINESEWVNTLYLHTHPWKTSHKAPQPSGKRLQRPCWSPQRRGHGDTPTETITDCVMSCGLSQYPLRVTRPWSIEVWKPRCVSHVREWDGRLIRPSVRQSVWQSTRRYRRVKWEVSAT